MWYISSVYVCDSEVAVNLRMCMHTHTHYLMQAVLQAQPGVAWGSLGQPARDSLGQPAWDSQLGTACDSLGQHGAVVHACADME